MLQQQLCTDGLFCYINYSSIKQEQQEKLVLGLFSEKEAVTLKPSLTKIAHNGGPCQHWATVCIFVKSYSVDHVKE